jgi:hypothetical protein
MPVDERLLLAAVMRVGLVAAALVNVALALGQYREYGDARGLRGFVSALAMLFAASALGASSRAFHEAFPGLREAFEWATTIGVSGFVIGLVFSVLTWTMDRRERRRRRQSGFVAQAHYDGGGDH